ncbi:TolC family protein [Thalassotalea sp. PLHSN55]|uniref:TolC family protein n=1 Tax=Thalassotalea sp. PLHSN55 TaxID=3435888 RepID=UPI003F840D99
MKKPIRLASAFSVCMLASCASFNDVTYSQQAEQQLSNPLNKQVNTENKINESSLSLTQLLALEESEKLIASAFEHNPSLQQSLLTLKIAQQQVTVTSSAIWPSVSAGVNANKVENTASDYSASLDVVWTLDIWQQLSDANNAQHASAIASAYQYQDVKNLLAANVMQAYLGLVQSAQLIEIERLRVAVYQTNEKVIIDRYRKGLIELSELDTAKSSTRSSQANLVNYQAQYQQALRNLSLLTGLSENQLNYRTDFPDVLLALTDVSEQNLATRPDLQQAYQEIIASEYQHKVAYKNLLPNLSLTASVGNSDANLHEALFGSGAWQLLGQLSAPLFNAGKLTSEVEIAKFNAEKTYWQFQETLLNAVNEVDNAVALEHALVEQIKLTKQALESARRSETTYTERYRQGTVSLIDLLQVQQQTFSLQAQVTELTYQHLTNRITLGLALGLGA